MSEEPVNTSRTRYEQVGELVSIYRRGNVWWANWQRDGRQHRRSLETRSHKQARLNASKLEVRLLTGTDQRAVKPAAVGEVIALYLQYLKTERRKPATITKYTQVLKTVSELARNTGTSRIDQIDITFVDRYRHHRVTAGRSPKTVYNESILIRQLVNFALQRKLLNGDPLAGLKLQEPKPAPQHCWSRDEVERILAASREPQRSIYTVLADTGCRIGEIEWLTWDDVDFRRNVLHIRPKAGWTPKSGDQRTIPLTSRVRALLQSRSRKHTHVFTAGPSQKYPAGDHRISKRRLLTSLKRLLRRLGLPGHLHTFRHAYISHALSTGTPEAVVRQIVGHVDSRTIQLYTHIGDRQMQEAMRAFQGPPNSSAPVNATEWPRPTQSQRADSRDQGADR